MTRTLFSTTILLTICQLLISCFASDKFDMEKEKAAIKSVIKKETEAYYKQDFETWKSTYVNEPYFREYGYWEGYPETVRVYNGFDTLRRFKKQQFDEDRTLWKNSIEERRNENFRVYPNVAWYTFEQVSYDSTRTKIYGKSVETRILEKHDGNWKIAYLGFHYLPVSPRKIN